MRRGLVYALPFLLCGCLTSKGRFISTETATTPLSAGTYYRIEPGRAVPSLIGPLTLTIQGSAYTLSGGADAMTFHLIRLVAGKDIYVAQEDLAPTSPKPDAANVGVLFGPITEDGFCDYSDQGNRLPGVHNGAITSKPLLRRWLVDHVDEIPQMTRGVCWVKLTAEAAAHATPSK